MVQGNRPDGSASGARPRKVPLPLLGFLGGAAIMGLILAAVALSGGGGGNGGGGPARPDDGHEFAGLATSVPTVEATIDLARETVSEITNLTSINSGDQLVIPKFNVTAPLTYRAVALDGIMPNPEGPDDVAYYDFSSWPGKGGAPGLGGNAVFAGHVDSGRVACKNGTVPPPCQAVFWDVNNLRIGDEIEVHVAGTVHKYSVTSNQPVDAANGPWDEIVSATAQESITLITCGGDFNRETREYNSRQVVVAVRI